MADDTMPQFANTMRDRKLLMQRIQELGPTEHAEIFKMLSEHGVDYTRNSNGIFVNLSCVPAAVLNSLNTFVSFYIDNNHSLNEYDKRLSECKINASAAVDEPGDAKGGVGDGDEATPEAKEVEGEEAEEGGEEAEEEAGEEVGPLLSTVQQDKKAEQMRFAQAKKKYAKRKVDTKRSDVDTTTNNLVPE